MGMWGLYWICLTLPSPEVQISTEQPQRDSRWAGISSTMLSSGSQLPQPWTPSGTQDMRNFWGEHSPSHCPTTFSEGFLHFKGFHGERRWSWHSGLGTQVSADLDLSGCNGERRGHHVKQHLWMKYEFFVPYRNINNNKIHLRHDHSQNLWTCGGIQNWPILFPWEGQGKQSPLVPITLFARKNISV